MERRVLVVGDDRLVSTLYETATDRPGRWEFESVASADAVGDVLDEPDGHGLIPGESVAGVVVDHDTARHDSADSVTVVETVRDVTDAPIVVSATDGSEELAARATVAGATAYVPGNVTAAETILDALADDTPTSRSGSREKIETLHAVATDLAACSTEQEVYERAIEAAEQVLEFDQCLLDVRRGDELVPVATSSGLPDGGAESTHIDEENVAARVARTGEATISDDLSEVTDADPEEMAYRSGFTVPVSDVGVFQAVAEELAAFDEEDLELAQLLVSHVAESLKRVRNRRVLREERDRFATLFENVPDPVLRASRDDATGGYVVDSVNAAFARTFGVDDDAVQGRPLATVVERPVEESGDAEPFADADEATTVVAREVRRVAADAVRDFILHVIPITRGDGDMYAIYTDITATKERERALERQNDRLDEFASVVSHDLRNPLNVAEGHLVNYRETGAEASLDEVADAHERMRTLIEDLLDLARSGEVVAEPSPVRPETAARRAWASLHAPDADLVVEDTTPVLADDARLLDVFANLFRNAVEHADPSVTVRVGDLADGDGFFVEDDGPGIPDDERTAVFETGYTTAADGSGFGLAIVEQVASAHGWAVTVTDADGGGARFEFRDVDRPQ